MPVWAEGKCMGDRTTPSSEPNRPRAAGPVTTAFARLLLHGLAGTASSHPRPLADLATALQASGLQTADAEEIRSALRLLVATGCVASLQPLADGGVLLTLTGRDMDHDDGVDRVPVWPPAQHRGTPTLLAPPAALD